MEVLMKKMSLKINHIKAKIKSITENSTINIATVFEKSEKTKIIENDQEEISTNHMLSVEGKGKSEIMFQCDLYS